MNALIHHPARITKAEKEFVKNLDFRNIKFLVKIRVYSQNQKEKKKNPLALAFLVMTIR